MSSVPDFPGAANGLQVENSGTVTKVGAAVDAGQIPFEMAVEAGVDFLIVHHGLFWGPPAPVTGSLYRKYKTCIENNLAVYSSHLPLDCHPEIGNNALIAELLQLPVTGQFHSYEGIDIGIIAQGYLSRAKIREKLEAAFSQPVTAIEFGSEAPDRIGILSGSGAGAIQDMLGAGIDTLITGELKQHNFNEAQEAGLNLYACGHYATETLAVNRLAQEVGQRFGLEYLFLPTNCPL